MVLRDSGKVNICPPQTASVTIPAAPSRTLWHLPVRTWLTIAGWSVLVVWALWWVFSFRAGMMVLSGITLVPRWYFLGLDFIHNYQGSVSWLNGVDPYVYYFGDSRGLFGYPPIVLPLFAWCAWLDLPVAVAVFAVFIAAVMAVGTLVSIHFRRLFFLGTLPAVLLVGAVLLSMPVLFAMERGNTDAVVLLMLLIAAWATARDENWVWDTVAGAALAVAFWVKIYPGTLFLAPLAVRRWRVFAMAVVMVAFVGTLSAGGTARWLSKPDGVQNSRVGPVKELVDWVQGKEGAVQMGRRLHPVYMRCMHSTSTYWSFLWERLGFMWLARIPSLLCAGLILGSLTLWVSLRVWRRRIGGWVVYPFMLWLALVATFLMPLSYDYNMIYLPLLIVAVWARRDPTWVHVLLGLTCLLWWQPVRLRVPMEIDVLVISKHLSLLAVTVCLLLRVDEAEAVRPTAAACGPGSPQAMPDRAAPGPGLETAKPE